MERKEDKVAVGGWIWMTMLRINRTCSLVLLSFSCLSRDEIHKHYDFNGRRSTNNQIPLTIPTLMLLYYLYYMAFRIA